MPLDVEPGNETLSAETVENVLLELNESGVFMRLRSLINGSHNFFDIEEGYIRENDESLTGSVLDAYLESIKEGLEIATRGLKEPEMQDAFRKALEPGSTERKVLLAYWDLKEDTPWYKAEHNITTYQTFKNEGFPNAMEIERVLGSI